MPTPIEKSMSVSALDQLDNDQGEKSPKSEKRNSWKRRSFDMNREEKNMEIVKQVEYYFGDENLAKDDFLLKEMARDNTGESKVRVPVVNGFSRMKGHNLKLSTLARIIKTYSSSVVVSEDNKWFSRAAPFPDFIFQGRRTLMVENCPSNSSIMTLTFRFTQFGNVEHVDYPVTFTKKNEDTEKIVAHVRYEDEPSAVKAIQAFRNKDEYRGDLVVSPVVPLFIPRPPETPARAHDSDTQPLHLKKSKSERNLRSYNGFKRSTSERSLCGIAENAPSPVTPLRRLSSQNLLRNTGSAPPPTGRRGSKSPFIKSPSVERELRNLAMESPFRVSVRRSSSMRDISSISEESSTGTSSFSPLAKNRLRGPMSPHNVLRSPRGPDGTTGFGAGRGPFVPRPSNLSK
eukprot:GCRY01000262.1.p1 GENE.GCRY01000262.1~~GCRY01000262.1.p1  ORF type:complete len:402 (+),score=74.49 GCRY01000262.1:271-1476(+)